MTIVLYRRILMQMSIVVAVDDGGCIGRHGTIPWHAPADLHRFRQITLGKPVIMGRKTWDSLPSHVRPLPSRTNLVISRDSPDLYFPGALRFDSFESALASCGHFPEVMIIGGSEIYKRALPLASDIYLTRVHVQTTDGDTYFPKIPPHFRISSSEYRDKDVMNPALTWERWRDDDGDIALHY